MGQEAARKVVLVRRDRGDMLETVPYSSRHACLGDLLWDTTVLDGSH
jgi:hypothetical protein